MKWNRNTKAIAGAAATATILGALMLLPEKPLPPKAYEGETVLGYTLPPKTFAIVEQNAPKQDIGSALAWPKCAGQASNSPCYLKFDRGDGSVVRLYIYRCMDLRDPEIGRIDLKNCDNQKAYDQKIAMMQRK